MQVCTSAQFQIFISFFKLILDFFTAVIVYCNQQRFSRNKHCFEKEDIIMFIPDISAPGSDRSAMRFHEDTSALHIGTLPPRNYFIPFGKAQQPFADRAQSERFELLSGSWGFTYYESIIDMPDGFTSLPPAGNIPVPSNWQLHGYDKPQYTNVNTL